MATQDWKGQVFGEWECLMLENGAQFENGQMDICDDTIADPTHQGWLWMKQEWRKLLWKTNEWPLEIHNALELSVWTEAEMVFCE